MARPANALIVEDESHVRVFLRLLLKELGIVHAVAPDALTAALDLAAELARRTPGALAAAKALVRSALDWDIDSSATNEQAAFAKLLRDDPAAAELLKDFLNSGGDLNAFG